MAIIYTQNWSAGNSLFTSMAHYDRSAHGVDPLYPEIREAEDVTVDAGHLTWVETGSLYDWQLAGIALNGFPTFNGEGGQIICDYTPTIDSLDEPNDYDPLIVVNPGNAGTLGAIQWYWDRVDGEFEIQILSWLGPPGDIFTTVPYNFVAGTTYNLRVCWRCGTHAPDFSTMDPDGYVRLYVNDVLVFEVTDYYLSIGINNMVTDVWFGHTGLLGHLDNIVFDDESCDPIISPPTDICDCIPENPDTPPGGTGPGPPPTVIPPVIPEQLVCAGSGLVPEGDDYVSPELWWNL